MRSTLGSSLLAVWLIASSARGDDGPLPPGVHPLHPGAWVPVTARLEYTLEAGTPGICPTEAELRGNGIAAYLGYDPFDPEEKGVPVGTVRLVVGRSAQGFTSGYEYLDINGTILNRNKFKVPGTDRWACRTAVDLASSEIRAAFTLRSLKLARETEASSTPRGSAAPEPGPAAVAGAPPPSIEPAPTTRPRRLPRDAGGMYLGADVDLDSGIAPTGSAGGTVWLAFRLRDPAVSIEAGLRGMGSIGPAQVLYPAAGVYVPYRWTYVAGILAAIVHRGPLFFGPVLDVGSLTVHTDDPRSGLGGSPPEIVGAGLRFGAEGSLTDGVDVRSLIEGEGILVAPSLITQSRIPIRGAPSFSSTVAIGLSFHSGWPGERSH